RGNPVPARHPAEISGTHQSDRKSDLAARRPRQKLAERDEIGIGLLVEPAAAGDELVAKISDMGAWPSEASQAKPEKDQQHLGGRTFLTFRLCLISKVRHRRIRTQRPLRRN